MTPLIPDMIFVHDLITPFAPLFSQVVMHDFPRLHHAHFQLQTLTKGGKRQFSTQHFPFYSSDTSLRILVIHLCFLRHPRQLLSGIHLPLRHPRKLQSLPLQSLAGAGIHLRLAEPSPTRTRREKSPILNRQECGKGPMRRSERNRRPPPASRSGQNRWLPSLVNKIFDLYSKVNTHA